MPVEKDAKLILEAIRGKTNKKKKDEKDPKGKGKGKKGASGGADEE